MAHVPVTGVERDEYFVVRAVVPQCRRVWGYAGAVPGTLRAYFFSYRCTPDLSDDFLRFWHPGIQPVGSRPDGLHDTSRCFPD